MSIRATCGKCGKVIPHDAIRCPGCGYEGKNKVAVKNESVEIRENTVSVREYMQKKLKLIAVVLAINFGFPLFTFFVEPIIGVIITLGLNALALFVGLKAWKWIREIRMSS